MVVTITSLRLKHWWGFFRLSLWGLRITRQAGRQPGFIEMKNTGFGYLHFTLSVWESEPQAKDFACSGAHRDALRESRSLAAEIRIYTFRSETVPDWKAAKKLLSENGRAIIPGGEKL